MKRFVKLTLAAVIALTGASQFVSADDGIKNSSNVGRLDSKLDGANIRVSNLIGMDIQNDQGESVGEINDIVLDARTGKVKYAAVTYGGFLGVGDKLFAVPFDALECKRRADDPGDRGELVFVLNVTQKQLEGAVGFDQYHWPNFADKNFTRDIDKRYHINRRDRREAKGVDVQIDRNGVDIDIRRDRNE